MKWLRPSAARGGGGGGGVVVVVVPVEAESSRAIDRCKWPGTTMLWDAVMRGCCDEDRLLELWRCSAGLGEFWVGDAVGVGGCWLLLAAAVLACQPLTRGFGLGWAGLGLVGLLLPTARCALGAGGRNAIVVCPCPLCLLMCCGNWPLNKCGEMVHGTVCQGLKPLSCCQLVHSTCAVGLAGLAGTVPSRIWQANVFAD